MSYPRIATAATAAVALLLATGAAAATRAPAPHRIVSLDLCADQLVLALADRGQIAALSHNAADPILSAEAGSARGLPLLDASAERLLTRDPDLVIGLPPRLATVLADLPPMHFRSLAFQDAASLAGIEANIRVVAGALGHSERGEALIEEMDARLARLGRAGNGRVAAYYQRRGYLTGAGTLVDELMRRVGLINLATRLGKPALSQLSLEELIAARPDYLIVESASARVADQGTELLHHPALARIRRLVVPQAWTVCGGPSYVLAAESLARQLSRR